MKVLVVNAGSSSLKYQLFDTDSASVLAKGNCERIGIEGSRIIHKTAGKEQYVKEGALADHSQAGPSPDSMTPWPPPLPAYLAK